MTRILITLLIILSISSLANAQFSKGSILLGGQISFSGYSSNNYYGDQNSHAGNFNISLGKAIQENTVIGINLSYLPYTTSNYYSSYNPGPIAYSNNGYGIGVFYRKYKSLGKEFYIFGEAGAEYTGSTETGKNDSAIKVLTGSSSSGIIYLMPGIAYKISKKFFLEITIPNLFAASFNNRTTTSQNTIPQTSKSNQFAISTSLSSNPLMSLGIGFRLNL
jgi:hypothetical protein